MTKIVGLLCWYDESPTWLASCVASMGRICDHVVAVDGRYRDYPTRDARSTIDQYEAITDAALSAGIGMTIHSQVRPWETEMEKRTELFRVGSLVAETGVDWYFILDADERLFEAPEKDAAVALLDQIREYGQLVALIAMGETVDPHANDQVERGGMTFNVPWRYEEGSPRFWLALDNMRVERNHFDYVGDLPDGTKVNLWGMYAPMETLWWNADQFFLIENLNRRRSRKRDEDRQAYYKTRDALGIEDTSRDDD